MPWFKVDDTLAFHHKTVVAGNASLGLWVRAGSWSMQTLTDGLIPGVIASQLGTKREADRLVDAGFWIAEGAGFRFHEWDERQPVAADVKAAAEQQGRSGSFGNHKRWHVKKKVVNPDCQFCQEAAA